METDSKKKRGRPPAFPDEKLKLIASTGPAQSRRSTVNALYAGQARALLGAAAERFPIVKEKLAWLLEDEFGRNSIWVELGRILGPTMDDQDAYNDMLECAKFLCEVQPATVKEGVALARRWRLGQDGGGDAVQLANVILSEVHRYAQRHSPVEHEVILEALTLAAGEYGKSKS